MPSCPVSQGRPLPPCPLPSTPTYDGRPALMQGEGCALHPTSLRFRPSRRDDSSSFASFSNQQGGLYPPLPAILSTPGGVQLPSLHLEFDARRGSTVRLDFYRRTRVVSPRRLEGDHSSVPLDFNVWRGNHPSSTSVRLDFDERRRYTSDALVHLDVIKRRAVTPSTSISTLGGRDGHFVPMGRAVPPEGPNFFFFSSANHLPHLYHY